MYNTSNVLKYAFLIIISTVSLNAQNGILLENFNLIDGTGKPIQKNKSLLIVNDTIHSIFNYGEKVPIENVERIILTGKYLLPGLFDSHTHLATDPSNNNLETVKKQLDIMIAHGITGVRDMGGDARLLAYLSRQALLDEIPSPDIYYSVLIAGPRFYAKDRRIVKASKGVKLDDAPWMLSINDKTDINYAINKAKGTGAIGVKLYADLSEKLVQKITKESHKQNLLVWSHAAILPVLPSKIIESNVDAISHSAMVASEHIFSKNTNPRELKPNELNLDTNNQKIDSLTMKMAKLKTYLDPTLLAFKDLNQKTHYNNAVTITKLAYKNGVSIIIGTDKGIDINNPENIPLIEEMTILVNEVKIPALEVIKSATKNSAELLGLDKLGTIETGKRANILIVNQNPLNDIKNLLKVYKVFKNGIAAK